MDPETKLKHISPKPLTFHRDRGTSLMSEARHVYSLLEAIRKCNSQTDTLLAIETIIQETCSIMECDRATVFMVDAHRKELVVKVAKGDVDIRIPWTVGIAGYVFQNGGLLNIPDAYSHPLFNKNSDVSSGYKTNSILCVPVLDEEGKAVAVLQAINKVGSGLDVDPSFNEVDETLILHIASQVGVMLKKCEMYESVLESQRQVKALLSIVRSLHGDMGINSLIFTMTERTPHLVSADRCTLYVVDDRNMELWSMHGAVEIRFPMDKGLAGHVATTGEKLNIPDCYEDPRFNQDVDKKTGYRTRSMLVMPLKANDQVVGVIQLINKKSGTFTEDDEEVLESFLGIAGPMLSTSQVFHRHSISLSEFDFASSAAVEKAVRKTAEMKDKTNQQTTILEGDEEEEEDEDEE